MTFTWWLVPIVTLGVLLILAPWFGKLWANRDEEQRRWVAQMRSRRWRR